MTPTPMTSMALMAPEIIILATAFTMLVADLYVSEANRRFRAVLALCGLLVALVTLVYLLPESGQLFGGRFVVDPVTSWFKIIFILAAAFTTALAWSGTAKEKLDSGGEFYTIMLLTISGMMFLISARDIITLYISLELATIPLYALVAWKKQDRDSSEAALKYVVYGAMASALILYGLGALYGLSGHSDLAQIGAHISDSPLLWVAVAMITAGIGFKLTLAPFHMWAADVYQGAPTQVTAYLSVASKAAGMAFMFQMFFGVFGAQLSDWGWLIATLATVTMTLGNLVAIVQKNIKRFMAFSAISQAGYLIMGFLGPYPEGVPAMIFYLLLYVFTNIAVFAVIIFYSDATGRLQISDYRGLSRTNPIVALAMMIGLFSLAGIPPLSGFVGKFFLFSIAAKAGMNWLVAVAALNSTVSLYYYLRIVRAMYMESPAEGAKTLPVSPVISVVLALTIIATVALGVIPGFYETIHSQTVNWLSVTLTP